MTIPFRRRDADADPLRSGVAALGLLALASAWLAPPLLPLLFAAVLALGALVVVWRHPTPFWAAWLTAAALTPEMTLSDLIGPEAFQPAIAAIKGGEIGLVALTALRFGVRLDGFNPIWAFAGMAVAGAVAGVHPGLGLQDTLRSLAGSATPLLVFLCVKPAGWGETLRRVVVWAPMLSVALGYALDLAGFRPVFVEGGGARLAGLGHPAFLAHVALTALAAALLGWLRSGTPRDAALILANLAILVLTGARAPLAYGALIVMGGLLLAPSAAVPRAHRLALCLIGLVALPPLLLAGTSVGSLRLFALAAGDAGHLSGRDLLWPLFEAAAAQAPWFGWGLGAGNLVVPQQGQVAQLLRTWAAHNEYLRLRVEGGGVGLGVLIALFVLWVATRTRRLPPTERVVMRLAFVALALHAATDNVLISTPACVFFAFAAAVFEGQERA